MISSGKWVLGFHGCDRSVAEAAITSGTHLELSKNKYDWLGNGIYFWENDPDRALEWAELREVKHPAVVGAIIDLGRCLELTEVTHLELVLNSYKTLCVLVETLGGLDELPKNQSGYEGDQDLMKRNLDCAVINHLHEARSESGKPSFDTVRSPFMEGAPLYEGAGIMSRTHTQICVRNPGQILGYFKPLF